MKPHRRFITLSMLDNMLKQILILVVILGISPRPLGQHKIPLCDSVLHQRLSKFVNNLGGEPLCRTEVQPEAIPYRRITVQWSILVLL